MTLLPIYIGFFPILYIGLDGDTYVDEFQIGGRTDAWIAELLQVVDVLIND